MNKKQFIILVIVVVLVGAAGWIVYQRGNNSWQNGEQSIGGKLLPSLPINDVAQITIQSGTNEVVLARREDLWRVQQRGDYPADFSKISSSLMKLADLKVVQSEDIGPSQLARFNLLLPGTATNSATLLELRDQNGKALGSLLLGKDHMSQPNNGESWPDGRYVIVGTNGAGVDLISDALDDFQPSPENWLDKTFIKIENPASIAVTYPVATNSWKMTRASATNDWKLADAGPHEKLDSSKLDDVTSPFESAEFNDVSPGTTAPNDCTNVTIETLDGLVYTTKVWPANDGNYSMTIGVSADEARAKNTGTNSISDQLADDKQFTGWTYTVPSYTVDSLLKLRSDLLLAETNTVAGTNTISSTK